MTNEQIRWFRRPKKVDKLLLAADHLHTLPRLTRAIVAELVLEEAILPMLRTYLDIGISILYVICGLNNMRLSLAEDNIFASQGGRTSSLEARGNVFPVASVVPNKTILSSTCGQEVFSTSSEPLHLFYTLFVSFCLLCLTPILPKRSLVQASTFLAISQKATKLS